MYIYAFSNHYEVVTEKLSDKKSQLKKRVNRSDNFVNLTLLGVQKCIEDEQLEEHTNLYIASETGNMNSFIKVFDAIFTKQQLPMPFNFLNSVNASLLFFVAKSFGIKGKAIFTDGFESALTQALVDVKNGKTVLVGVVHEAISNLELHQKKFNTTSIEEESSWLLLAPKLENSTAIAHIDKLQLHSMPTKESTSVKKLFDFLESSKVEQSFQGNFLSFIVEKG